MMYIGWIVIQEYPNLLIDFSGDWAWLDCRSIAQDTLSLQAAEGTYPSKAIFDLSNCHTESQEVIYSLKRLLDLRVVPNLTSLTLVGNRKRVHMLAQLLDEQTPYRVQSAKDLAELELESPIKH